MSLMDFLPDYYKNSDEVNKLQNALDYWVDILEKYKEELLLQLNVNTATWGLELWEKQYGIKTDYSKSIELRRERIKAKMSGIGTFNKTTVQNFINTIEHGSAEIIEYPAKSTFIIKFNDYYKVPTDESIKELNAYLEEVKPAHLAHSHTYTYNWWGKINGTMTWGDAANMTWGDLRKYKEG